MLLHALAHPGSRCSPGRWLEQNQHAAWGLPQLEQAGSRGRTGDSWQATWHACARGSCSTSAPE